MGSLLLKDELNGAEVEEEVAEAGSFDFCATPQEDENSLGFI